MMRGSPTKKQASCEVTSCILFQVVSQLMEDTLHQKESNWKAKPRQQRDNVRKGDD